MSQATMKQATMKNEGTVLRLVFSLATMTAFASASVSDVGLTDRLAERADIIVAGQVQSGRQNGNFISFALAVDRIIKGNVAKGEVLTVVWETSWTGNRDLGGNYGLWFLGRNSDGSFGLLPTTQGRPHFDTAYFALSPTNPPPSSDPNIPQTMSGHIMLELLTGMQHYKDVEQLRNLLHGIGGIVDPSRVNIFRALSASSDQELKFIGLAGLIGDHEHPDLVALTQLANQASVIPSLKTREFAIGAIGSILNGDPAVIQALATFAASRDPDMQRTVARALSFIHTPQSLPLLVPLLDSADPQVVEWAIRGLSRFVDNFPIATWDNVRSGKAMIPQGTVPFKTAETDHYSLSRRPLDTAQQTAYVQFWKSWWLKTKNQIPAN